MLPILTYPDRAGEAHGAKLLITGPPGVGKTSLTGQLMSSTTLFADIEAGTLSIKDIPVDIVRPQTWPECRDLAVRLGGVDPAAAPGTPYSAERLEEVGGPLDSEGRYT